jgi:hypothetical protein
MRFYILFLLITVSLINIAYAAVKECKAINTNYYLQNRGNIPGAFFYPQTAFSSGDKCQVISNSELRSQYPWLKTTDQVEHIIDSNNGPDELANCNKNIRGNLIIAIGTWNNAVGNLCWKYVAAEKQAVYGPIFNTAMTSVKECCGINDDGNTVSSVFICLLIIMFVVITALAVYRSRAQIHEFISSKIELGYRYYEVPDSQMEE